MTAHRFVSTPGVRARRLTTLFAASLATLASLVAPTTARAISFDANGKIVEWNITPFSQPNGSVVAGTDGVSSTWSNNYSPLNFPNGIGHVPSPGGSTGEKFDLEEMHVRNTGSKFQVLLIASSLYQATNGGSTLKLGDLLLDIDNDNQFDLGVVTQSANAGLDAGRLYEIQSTKGLQNVSGSYHGTSIASEIGAWAIDSGIGHDLFAIETTSFNFGGSEGTTYAYQYTFDLGFMQVMPDQFAFQMAWGCGNDMIEAFHLMSTTPTDNNNDPQSPIPEPAPFALFLVLGWVALTVAGRMRRPEKA